MAVVMVSFHRRVLNRSVHPFDLAVGPRVVGLRQPVLDPVCFAYHIEAHLPGRSSVSVAGLICELNTVVSQDRVDAIGEGLEQIFEELPCSFAVCLVHELRDCKLAGPVNPYEEVELALRGLNFGNVDLKEADGVSLELLPLWHLALDIRQARDAMPLKAPMQRRTRQRRN